MAGEGEYDQTESLGDDAGKKLDSRLVGNRYVLLDPVGEGGSAVVYTAYDRKLDRKIAIKVLRRTTTAGIGEDRLLREAQALARLRHPNVVTVHDAGSIEDRVFVAMELVEGQSLRGWLATDPPRPWREVVTAFVAAGRGLAAAHDAGLVHRDFKPDNVLVGRDGSIRVADFGLARLTGQIPTGDDASPASPASPLESDLTRTGAILGTPRYMAPEQLAGTPVDARGDQFSFCAALYEGLFRQRPFAGEDLDELRGNVDAGKVREPPARARVPRWLTAAVLRGLRAAPAERWPSMQALLGELTRDRGRTRRRLLTGAVVAAVVASFAVVLLSRRTSAAQACAADPARLAGVWDAPTRAALLKAFGASGRPHADDLYRRAARELDGYTGAWTALRKQACEATAVRHEQSEALLDLRMACLDRRRDDLRALTELLGHAENVSPRTLQALQGLRPIDDCADTAALTSSEPVPPRELRAAVDAVRRKVARVEALSSLGRMKPGLAELPAIRDEASRIAYAPLSADVEYLASVLQQDTDPRASEAALINALTFAAEAKNDNLIARAAMLQLFLVGTKEGRTSEALAMRPLAMTAMHRIGDPPRFKGMLLTYIGYVQMHGGRYADAEASFRTALALLETGAGVRALDIVRCLIDLMQITARLERYDEAEVYGRRAMDLLEKNYGPDMFDLASVVNELGGIAMARHDLEAARRYYGRTRDILVLNAGPRSSSAAVALENLGDVALAQGRLDEARASYEQSLAIRHEIYGDDDARTARSTMKVGEVLLTQGRLDEARARLDAPLAVVEKHLEPEDDDLAEAFEVVARLRRAENAPDKAIPLLERAVAIYDKSLGPESQGARKLRAELAETRSLAGRRPVSHQENSGHN